ncbi:MAG: hypothetical protein GX301_11165, partial [Gracilibacteraceae bacterium]|nr:hypothetical protein [Gracilibacteraceae bacterium]
MATVLYQKTAKAGGIILIAMGLIFPALFENYWFSIIMKIREAILTGDSGHLILASASLNCLFSIQSTILYLG